MGETGAAARAEARNVTLLELVDRVLDRGVVLSGDITIAVADVDLITVGLRLLLASTERMRQTEGMQGLILASPVDAKSASSPAIAPAEATDE